MTDKAQVLDFVKALSDADRLRVIGLLARHAATTREVAAGLGMPFRTAFKHLGQLEFAGVVHKTNDLYQLDEDALEKLSRSQFAARRAAYVPAPELDARTRSVLKAYLNADGSLRQIPSQASKLQIILRYLITAFEPGVDYTEKHVNDILRRFHADTAALRRALVDAGLLQREGDGSRYWRNRDQGIG